MNNGKAILDACCGSRMFWHEHHLWIDLTDADLTPEQRNSAIWLGQQIYPKEAPDGS